MMKKLSIFTVLGLLTISSLATASYAGPFLFWGMENLSSMKIPTLQGKNQMKSQR
jgi:hypothetical protein